MNEPINDLSGKRALFAEGPTSDLTILEDLPEVNVDHLMEELEPKFKPNR